MSPIVVLLFIVIGLILVEVYFLIGTASLLAMLGGGMEDLTFFGWGMGITMAALALTGAGFVVIFINFLLIHFLINDGEASFNKFLTDVGIIK